MPKIRTIRASLSRTSDSSRCKYYHQTHTHTEQQENNQKNWFMSRKLCLVCVRISKIAFFPAMHIYVGEDASRMLLAARSRLHMRTRKAPQCIADEPRGSCMVSPGFLYFHFHTYIVVCDPDLSDRS